MEEGIAKSLKLKLGDTLTFDIAGTPVTATITSLRKVDWDSFRPNFFTLFAPGVLEVDAADLSRRGARAGRAAVRRVAVGAGAAVSERARDRRRRDHAAGPGDHRAGRERGRVRVPVHAGRRPAGAAGGDRGDAGRAPLRRGDPAHAGRVAGAAHRRADRRVPRAGLARGSARGGRRDRDRLRAVRSRVPDPVRGESAGVARTASAAARSS